MQGKKPWIRYLTQWAFTWSKSTMEKPNQCEIYRKLTIKTLERRYDVILVFLLLTLNIFHLYVVLMSSFEHILPIVLVFRLLLWTSTCRLGILQLRKRLVRFLSSLWPLRIMDKKGDSKNTCIYWRQFFLSKRKMS